MMLWSVYGLELHKHRHAELLREAELHRLAEAAAGAGQRQRGHALRRALGATGSGLVAVGRRFEATGNGA